MQVDKEVLKNMIIEFLEKLNTGGKITYNEMELKFSGIKAFIDDILYSIDDFPVDNHDDQIYCFREHEKKFFDKYEVQDIADAILEYTTESAVSNEDKDFYNNVIMNYINNKGTIEINGTNSTGVIKASAGASIPIGGTAPNIIIGAGAIGSKEVGTAGKAYVKPSIVNAGLIKVNDNFSINNFDMIIEPNLNTGKQETYTNSLG